MARFREGRLRQKRLRYALSSAFLSFAAGWAVITLLMPPNVFPDFHRWQTSLWTYLGTHYVRISDVHFGGAGFRLVDPVATAQLPDYVYLVPVGAVSASAIYTCYNLNSTRIKHNLSNALASGLSYFLIGLAVIVLTDAQPPISMLLIIALVVGGGIWIGSNIMGFLTQGFPFIGIASLGGIAAIGILIIFGGVAILAAILGLVLTSFGVAATVGFGFGMSRKLDRRGRKDGSKFTRSQGLKTLIVDYWEVLLVSGIIGVALFFGLTKGP